MRALLQKGAEINTQDSVRRGSEHQPFAPPAAVPYSLRHLLRCSYAQPRPALRCAAQQEGVTPALSAAKRHDAEVLRLLLDAGADIEKATTVR